MMEEPKEKTTSEREVEVFEVTTVECIMQPGAMYGKHPHIGPYTYMHVPIACVLLYSCPIKHL